MTSGLAASTDRHYGAATTNLEGPDPKLVVRNQLINAHQYLLAARQDKSVPNSVGSALLSLHAAVKALADVVLEDDQNGSVGSGLLPTVASRAVPRNPDQPNLNDQKF